jgi:hypothetical protein
MDFDSLTRKEVQAHAKKLGIKANGTTKEIVKRIKEYIQPEDGFNKDVLIRSFNSFKRSYYEDEEIMKITKSQIRHENLREHISENMVKFIIQNFEGDKSCVWAKSIGVAGDLYSVRDCKRIEVKAFTSDGPTQFGPKKEFDVIYFLDMRKWQENLIILWKVYLTNESIEFKNLKVNKKQTHEEQCAEGRRPRIKWESLYPQISEHCQKIYEGTFDGIFKEETLDDPQSTEPQE